MFEICMKRVDLTVPTRSHLINCLVMVILPLPREFFISDPNVTNIPISFYFTPVLSPYIERLKNYPYYSSFYLNSMSLKYFAVYINGFVTTPALLFVKICIHRINYSSLNPLLLHCCRNNI